MRMHVDRIAVVMGLRGIGIYWMGIYWMGIYRLAHKFWSFTEWLRIIIDPA